MKKAQEVRRRRKEAMAQELNQRTDSRVYQVFNAILDILDKNTDNADFGSVKVGIGPWDYTVYSVKKDGFYRLEQKIVSFSDEIILEDFLRDLNRFINSQDGYLSNLEKNYSYDYNTLTIDIV